MEPIRALQAAVPTHGWARGDLCQVNLSPAEWVHRGEPPGTGNRHGGESLSAFDALQFPGERFWAPSKHGYGYVTLTLEMQNAYLQRALAHPLPNVSNIPERETSMSEKMQSVTSDLLTRAKGALTTEPALAGWRLVGETLIERSPRLVLARFIESGMIGAVEGNAWADRLSSGPWSGIYGIVVGTALVAHPSAARKPWIGRAAAEMRIEGWKRVGKCLVDPVLDVLHTLVIGTVGLDAE